MKNLSEILNVTLDKKIHEITIPANVCSFVIVPADVDVHLAYNSSDFTNMSGDEYLGPNSVNVGILTPLAQNFKFESEDLPGRKFYLASIETGSCTIFWEKNL